MNRLFSRSSIYGSGRTFVVAAIAVMALAWAPGAQATPGTCDTAGPIEVESTLPSGPTAYATLQLAFADINAGVHQGAITIDVCGNTAETVSAILNASGTGSALYTSVAMAPAGGAAWTISGAIAGVLVDLNGADSVTIDGLNSGGNALTFDNTSATATPATIA